LSIIERSSAYGCCALKPVIGNAICWSIWLAKATRWHHIDVEQPLDRRGRRRAEDPPDAAHRVAGLPSTSTSASSPVSLHRSYFCEA